TAPLYWFTAARPLSDMPGLAAALAVQALTLTAATPARLATASVLGGLAAGLRSQVAWLTVPLIGLAIARRPSAERGRSGAASPGVLTLVLAFVPYLLFDLLFQETVTTRYALPLVPPMAYLAVRAQTRFVRSRTASFVFLAVVNLSLAMPAVYWYSRVEAPAF